MYVVFQRKSKCETIYGIASACNNSRWKWASDFYLFSENDARNILKLTEIMSSSIIKIECKQSKKFAYLY